MRQNIWLSVQIIKYPVILIENAKMHDQNLSRLIDKYNFPSYKIYN